MYVITIRKGQGESSLLWLWWVDHRWLPSKSGSSTNPGQAALMAAEAVNAMREHELADVRTQAAGEHLREPYSGVKVPRGRKRKT